MENIKITYIPQKKLETNEGFVKSLTDTALYDTDLINLHILYNTCLTICIEDTESIFFEYTTYINQKDLYYELKNIINTNEDEYVIALLGFDLTLDEIKTNICPLVQDLEEVFLSINIITDDEELKNNNNVYLDSDCVNCTDEEWENIKNDLDKAYKEESNKENDFEVMVYPYDLKSNSLSTIYDLIDSIANDNISDKILNDKAIENYNKLDKVVMKDDEKYVSYSYEDIDNYISISFINDIISIEDEEGSKILFTEKALNFVLETLNKFYNH